MRQRGRMRWKAYAGGKPNLSPMCTVQWATASGGRRLRRSCGKWQLTGLTKLDGVAGGSDAGLFYSSRSLSCEIASSSCGLPYTRSGLEHPLPLGKLGRGMSTAGQRPAMDTLSYSEAGLN